MAEANRSKGWPFLVGLDHDNPSKEILSNLYEFIDAHANEGRTLFFEKHSFFQEIADYAKSKGLNTIMLDRKIPFSGIDWKRPSLAVSTMLYLTYTVRERDWSNRLRSQAKEGDIFLAHSAHIDGLVEHHSFPKEKILFKQDYHKTSPRLSPETVKQLQDFRHAERKKRQKKKQNKKNTLLFSKSC